MATQTKTISALLMVMGMLMLGVLACNSDAPDFAPIVRTATPTITPTVEPFDGETTFQVGDSVRLVGGFQTFLMRIPQEDTGIIGDRVIGGCFRDIMVDVVDITQRGGIIFYQIDCGSGPGWTIEENLELVEE